MLSTPGCSGEVEGVAARLALCGVGALGGRDGIALAVGLLVFEGEATVLSVRDRGPVRPRAAPRQRQHRDAHQHLLALRAPASERRLLTTEVALIDLHDALEPLAAGTHQHRAQPLQHRPRRVIRADLERALQTQCCYPVLLGREQPAGHEPHRQRRARLLEDRPGRHRSALAALTALVPPVRQLPGSGVRALGAHEPLRASQPSQVVQAVSIGREPRLKLAQRSRIVSASHGGQGHSTTLLRQDGYSRVRLS